VDANETHAALQRQLSSAIEPITGVRLAYLFGSQSLGTARPDSDLDLAIQMDRTLDGSQRADLLLDLLNALGKALGSLGERADILDLDRASPAVAFRAIRDGQRLICRDARERAHVEARIARYYDDTRPQRELFQRAAAAAAQRMKRGSLGRP
jgi:uncharacterized protein